MAPGVRPRVLVIEDDRSVRVFVCDVLESLGYATDDAEGGVQGLALLERHRYDLVITDLRMPHVTGWDVVNAVRGRRPTMPMIMISGFATYDDVRRAQRLGVPLLHKPFSVSELRRVVRELLAAEASQLERRTESDVPRKPLMKAPEEPQEGQEAQENQG
jgi:DNA-binding response OmpR family regulator